MLVNKSVPNNKNKTCNCRLLYGYNISHMSSMDDWLEELSNNRSDELDDDADDLDYDEREWE